MLYSIKTWNMSHGVLLAILQSCIEDSLKIVGGLCKGSIIEGEGGLNCIHDFFLAIFGVNNRQIYMA